MPHDEMTECEHQRKYKLGNAYEWKWKLVPVSEIIDLGSPKVRCAHCSGAVRIHKRQVPSGPRDHVEHRSRQDSEGCRAGHYF